MMFNSVATLDVRIGRYDEAAAAFFSACCSFFNSSRYGALTSLNLTRTVMPRTETVSCLLPMSSTVPTLSRLLTKTCWPTFNFDRSTGSRWGFSASGREICWIARRALSMALAFSRSVPSLDWAFNSRIIFSASTRRLRLRSTASRRLASMMSCRFDVTLSFSLRKSSSSFRASRRRYSSSACSSSIFLACALSWVRTFSISMS